MYKQILICPKIFDKFVALILIYDLEQKVEIFSEIDSSLYHNTEQKTRNFTALKTRTYTIILNIGSP
jgi:hypothetical protein